MRCSLLSASRAKTWQGRAALGTIDLPSISAWNGPRRSILTVAPHPVTELLFVTSIWWGTSSFLVTVSSVHVMFSYLGDPVWPERAWVVATR